MSTSFLIGLIAGLINLAGMLLTCSLMSYALVRLRWHGRGLAAVLATILAAGLVWIPPALLLPIMIPHFGFADTAPAFSFCAVNGLIMAFAVALFWQRTRDIPRQLEDSARLDGCGWWRIYWHVVLPFVRKELALIAFLVLVSSPLQVRTLIMNGDGPFFLLFYDPFGQRIPIAIAIFLLPSLLMTLPAIGTFMLAKRYLKEPVRPVIARD